ncbi:MAG: glycosyltransferase family 2 protein [Muribaculaceae bacterium]|nr:glycosyltransferase family 2 protein [Muribaculaceae bacterium]
MEVSEDKKLAVIILNWNGLELLRKFLPTAVTNTRGPEVDLIVADNGSTDGSVRWVMENYPDLKLIVLDKNYGYAGGYNRVIDRTRYPYTILLNSDVEVEEGWWQPLLRFMENNPDVGAVQPKIKSFHRKDYFEYAGAAGGLLDKNGYPYCRGRVFDIIEKDEGQYDGKVADICWASGAALAVNTEVYLELGGLDTLFFAHMEEIDLCCRMLIKGYRVCMIPDSQVFHVGGASLNQGNPRKTYLNFRNNLLLLYKNLPVKGRERKLIIRRLLDTLAFFMFVVKMDFGNAGAILKAHRDYRKLKKNYPVESAVPENFKFPGSRKNILIERYLKTKI